MCRVMSLAVAVLLVSVGDALAQTSFVNPNGAGGYAVITPGQSPTFINLDGSGGYTAITPSQPPTFNLNGGGFNVTMPAVPQFNAPPAYPYRPYQPR